MNLPDAVVEALAHRYRVERELGSGGAAVVYLAQDADLGYPVALKILKRAAGAAIGTERFLTEIRITAALQHPNILPLLDSGEAAGRLYYAMPYLTDGSLRDRLAAGPLTLGEALPLLRQVAEALAHAHQAGIIHRDVKPENILLQGGEAMVADFGIARASSTSLAGRRTTAGIVLGTPAYMAPEQATGDGTLDHRADLYGFGVLAYEVLAGEPLFAAPNPQALIAAHVAQLPPRLHEVRPTVTRPVSDLVNRCLEKDPGRRWPHANDLARRLRHLERTAGQAPDRGDLLGRFRHWLGRGAD
ncbi:MAG: serine/threonine protein kinase [Gemmatimonadales bacterium]|nr:serine/threonine protein kinase [Gemmatimonadales bacterium]